MARVTALLITSDPALAKTVRDVIQSVKNLKLEVISSAVEAHSWLYRPDLALVLAHLGRRESDVAAVIYLLELMAARRRSVAVAVLCEQPNPELALALVQRGACECLERPLDLHRLAYLADALTVAARDKSKSAVPVADFEAVTVVGDGEPFLITAGSEMARTIERVLRVVPRDTTVLFSGETGTGKSRLARLIHELSPRRSEPFVVVNCAGLSAHLMESELFGHVKGAFTGADRDRTGKCAEAGQGTLMLDEVDTLPLELQAKLLRVVEDRVFEPVGCNQVLSMKARLMVASNRQLAAEVAAGRFRSDLYFRCNVVQFRLPALRERPALYQPLMRYFLHGFAATMGRKIQGFDPEALNALSRHSWPGNIRECRNAIESAVALSAGSIIRLEDLPEYLHENLHGNGLKTANAPGKMAGAASCTPTASPLTSLTQAREDAEAARITETLARNHNNRQRTAIELGISRMTLYKKLHRYGLMGAS